MFFMAGSVISALDKVCYGSVTHYEGQWLYSIYSVGQTGVIHHEVQDPQLSHQAHKIQTIFNAADIGFDCRVKEPIVEIK